MRIKLRAKNLLKITCATFGILIVIFLIKAASFETKIVKTNSEDQTLQFPKMIIDQDAQEYVKTNPEDQALKFIKKLIDQDAQEYVKTNPEDQTLKFIKKLIDQDAQEYVKTNPEYQALKFTKMLTDQDAQEYAKMNFEDQTLKFPKMLTDQEAQEYVHLAKVLIEQLDRFNITYFAIYGTLLGIHRHMGSIPWDDDLDIAIDGSQKQDVLKALQSLDKEYVLLTDTSLSIGIWRFFRQSGKPIAEYVFKYPFIDIFFWNETLPGYFGDEYLTNNKWPQNATFPLIKRMYGEIPFYTPCDMETILDRFYQDMNVCVSPYMTHKKVRPLPQTRLSCDALKVRYPFVKREHEKRSDHTIITDSLMTNNILIKKVRYNIPNKCSGDLSYFDSHLQVLFDSRKRI